MKLSGLIAALLVLVCMSNSALAENVRKWQSHIFLSPNGGLLVFTILPDGNPACASYDQQNCLWGKSVKNIDFKKVKPLACGSMHKEVWGETGYENPKHWCNVAKGLAK